MHHPLRALLLGSALLGPAAAWSQGASPEVELVVRAYGSEVVRCYGRAVEGNPDARGTVTLAWTVRSGHARDVVVVANETGDEPLARCLRRRVRRWRHPEGLEGPVSWPFRFDHR